MNIRRFSVLALAGIVPIIVFLLLPMGTWASISSLPMHPLIVHGVIVALPVTAIWLLVSAWKPALFARTFTALWGLSVLAVLGVVAAKSSGDSLAAAVGLPNAHADAGNRLIPVSIAMAATVLVVGFFSLVRPHRTVAIGARSSSAVAALAALPLVYLAGHSGAEAVWEEEYAEAQQPIAPGDLTLSMEEVERHATPGDCWTVVDGSVYDVTTFIARHPAGAGDVEEMCGADASDDFLGEHGGQGEPEQWLATLRIGTLAE
ncbi:MAG: cytochrome b5 domain-containing protein [Ilumatobacter sp.]|uniref:cytochrome b5 domain-containing protein n=1 Tax=Ilumatobacter sp. TaxID=1967498 RepID=UPI00391DE323